MALKEEIEKIVNSAWPDPFEILGSHVIKWGGKECVAVRAFLPEAAEAAAVDAASGQEYAMRRLHKEGFFEAVIRGRAEVFPYRLKETYQSGASRLIVDPYSFLPVLSDYDLYLIAEGTHYDQYEKLGAHEMTVQRRGGRLVSRSGRPTRSG